MIQTYNKDHYQMFVVLLIHVCHHVLHRTALTNIRYINNRHCHISGITSYSRDSYFVIPSTISNSKDYESDRLISRVTAKKRSDNIWNQNVLSLFTVR